MKLRNLIWGIPCGLSLLFSGNLIAQQDTVIITNGSSWTVPSTANPSSISVECWGAGGAGAYTSTEEAVGGAGGGGAYAKTIFTNFTVGQTISYEIGTGGSGTSGANAGGDTWFYVNGINGVKAEGGKGAANNSSVGANGGSASNSFGDITLDGGKGGNGSFDSGAICGDEAASGGGGAAATPLSAGAIGGNASTSTGGVFCAGNHSDGGIGASNLLFQNINSEGGDGVTYSGNGVNGLYGAGGSGAVSNTYNGGDGGDGLIRIIYSSACNETATQTINRCGPFTWINGVQYITSNNTATHIVAGAATNGCDSVYTLNLTITVPDVTTTQVGGGFLSANATGADYQWIDCSDNSPITGATNQDFTPSVNGSYAVIVTENGCSATSDCMVVNNASLEEEKNNTLINVFPNPAQNFIHVSVSGSQNSPTQLKVIDAAGRVLKTQNIVKSNTKIDISRFNKGVYFVKIISRNTQSMHRFIKN
ncbi:hypothetical protein CW751_06960 [Brumimicrobium salinarum]|uniref:Uncharacterized protein n=1 Tax=Brumimicrobium salinarum TaxID=2058658 RepID=A0A2I0R2U5_9FLAO|nr:T9SS type A sorting domain-containing protein [Brumimicrobium salinarum]PKR80903.1 hypothetical protein CW751_06960 [Brumimicrobium salinarum]